MNKVNRVSAAEVAPRIKAGEALLVCAYDDDDAYRTMRLEGAISYRQFLAQKPNLDRRKEIILYCA